MSRLLIALTTAFLAYMPIPAACAQPSTSISVWKDWIESLTTAQFRVTRGSVFVMYNEFCPTIVNVFGSCFGNNAAAPYIVPQVPIDGTDVADYALQPPFLSADQSSDIFYRLRDTDALVTLVTLPPTAAYLGYQGYLFTRAISNYSTTYPDQVISPDPDRYEIFGSFGNDINSAIVGDRLRRVWNNGAVVYVTTSNQQLANALVADAKSKGFDNDRIFVEPVGANILTGPRFTADDMVTLIRYALPKDPEGGDLWTRNAASNVLVYRVSAPAIPVSRFPAPQYSKKVAISEGDYAESLAELIALLAGWIEKNEGKPVIKESMISSDNVDQDGNLTGIVGAACISKGTNCLGDNQDTDGYRFGLVGLLVGKKAAFVAGANHARLDNAHYVSLAVYNMNGFSGVASASQSNPTAAGFNSGTLTGSAKGVLMALALYNQASPKLKSQLSNLYVAMLSRDCTGAANSAAVTPYCVDLSDAALAAAGIDLPLDAPIAVTQRAYLKPGETSGANPDLLLPPVLVFRPVP